MSVNKWETNDGIYLGREAEDAPVLPAVSPEPPNLLTGQWRAKPVRKRPEGGHDGEHEFVGDRHLLMFGPNGSGKSWRVLMPNLCRLVDWSMVVVDPKGALAAYTAVHRAKLNAKGEPTRKVVVIDPFRVIEESYPRLVERFPFFKSHGLNPLAALDLDAADGEAVDDARTLAASLIKVDHKGESHWAHSAQALLQGLILALVVLAGDLKKIPAADRPEIKIGTHKLAFDAENPAATLGMVRQLVGAAPSDLAIFNERMVEDFGEDYPAIAETLNRFTKFTPENRELLGILSTAITQTQWLSSPRVRQDLAAGSFDFGRLKREPVTVFLVIPPRYLGSHATWLRLMITAALLPLLRSVEDGAVPVLFALDEYAALGHMEVIENNMALMREYGVKLWPVLQDLNQMKEIHGENRWQSFVGNAGVRALFAPQDHATQDYFSNLSGKTVWTYETTSSSSSWSPGGNSGGSNTGQSKSLVPRFAGEHLGSIERGQGVLYVSETRSGRANVLLRSVFPDPRSVAYDPRKSAGTDTLNDAAGVIASARKWIG